MIVIGKDVKIATRGTGTVKQINEYIKIYEGSGIAVAKGKDMTVYIKAKWQTLCFRNWLGSIAWHWFI
ncbi:MAG: hypothetical protein QXL78_06755 [Methanocellales archaeon]